MIEAACLDRFDPVQVISSKFTFNSVCQLTSFFILVGRGSFAWPEAEAPVAQARRQESCEGDPDDYSFS